MGLIPDALEESAASSRSFRRQLLINRICLVLTLASILFSVVSQVRQHIISVQGVGLIWPLAGLFFASIKLLLVPAMRAGITAKVGSFAYILSCKDVRYTRVICGLLVLTNTVLLGSLLYHGVPVLHWTLYAVIPVWIGTAVWWFYHRKDSVEDKLLVIGVGVNIIPTYVQAVAYVFLGSGGMPWVNMIVLLVMALGMYFVARPQEVKGLRGAAFKEASRRHPLFRLTRYDLFAQLVMGACCFAARFLLPLGWWHESLNWVLFHGLHMY